MKYLIPIAAMLLLTTSCFTVVHEYGGSREITPGTKLSQPSTKVATVSQSRKANFLFWGLVDLNSASGPEIAEEAAVVNQGQDFDGLTRLNIREEQGPVDVLVEILTLGIFSMLTVETDADVHRFDANGGGA